MVPSSPENVLPAHSAPRTQSALRAAFSFPDTISAARWSLHWLLFFLTLCSTTLVGAMFQRSFDAREPLEFSLKTLEAAARHPLDGLAFSLTLMAILLAHELGHYFACQYYGIDASLPYFLPFPSPIGTIGAFIRIRSPIYTRQALFDVGIAGPLAGFALLVPAMVIGIGASRILPGSGIAERGDLIFGVPAIQRFFAWIIFPHARATDILLHPVARAAWVGTLATALNLLPIGQLDGGHILYSFFGRWHKLLSRIFVLALIPLGIFYSLSWFVWAALLFFLALRHPVIYDITPLNRPRVALGLAALVIFLLTFTLVPLR